ncbi:MAG: cytochrome c biogenesis protein CcsA [Chloroflexi bacterium]|nr:cytochrome c biogenesis protein CcsA [Chloroflexota bacterium]
MFLALYLVFLYAPIEKVMGIVQKNFYLMVPMGWLSLLSYFVIFIGSIFYLTKRDRKWDDLAYSAAEVGIIFTSLALMVGSIWARPIWGVWWAWEEPRLTTTLVLWFIYLACLLVRSLTVEEGRGATFAAVVGVIGFIDIPFVILSTSLWRGMHPPLIIFEEGGLDPRMRLTLMLSIVAYTVLYVVILMQRVAIRRDEAEVKKLKGLVSQES